MSVAARRNGVAFAEGRGLSQRRATALLKTARSSLKYVGKKAAAETTCDRFALRNYRRRSVTEEDAAIAMRRE